MILARRKKIREIKKMLQGKTNIILIGCRSCSAPCDLGSSSEVENMSQILKQLGKSIVFTVIANEGKKIRDTQETIQIISKHLDKADCILSLCCGSGSKALASRVDIPVYSSSALVFVDDSGFLKRLKRNRVIYEMGKGDGVAPQDRCPKKLVNGPCGGAMDGKCEVSHELDCSWVIAYEKLKAEDKLARLDNFVSYTKLSWDESIVKNGQKNHKMSKLEKRLTDGEFVVVSEISPPKGIDFSKKIEVGKKLINRVVAINITDFQLSAVKSSPISLSKALFDHNIESIFQITGRDRNRIALQGELLSAGYYGVKNVLAVTGDYSTIGDSPDAKPVFELDSIGILQAASCLNNGTDMSGNELKGKPDFFLGAVVTPAFEPFELQIMKLKKKVASGARFIQTQAVFSLENMRRLREATKDMNVFILAGIIPIKSVKQAIFMNDKFPGVTVSEKIIDRLRNADDEKEEGIKIAAEFIRALKREKLCDGIHVMAVYSLDRFDKLIQAAGL